MINDGFSLPGTAIYRACLYSTVMVSKYGMTIRKRILKVKVVMASAIPFLSVKRFIVSWQKLLRTLLFAGYVMAFFDSEKRTLHDRIAQTRVVKCR